MTSDASLLMLGCDLPLLQTRASVLRFAGYKVRTLASGEGFPEATERMDLLVLCHSLSEIDRNVIRRLATALHPAAELLCLTPTRGSLAGFPHLFSSYDGPARLIETVQNLLSGQQPISA